MIYLTQLIYIHPGQQDIFHQFEEIAIPTIAKYNGRLSLRIRPSQESKVSGYMETPYEIHIVEFEIEQDFEDFKNDDERRKFLHLKEKAIKSSLLIGGQKL